MKSVVTFGEIMLRLSTPGYQRFIQAQQFEINFGGGEANVAVSLAQFGVPSVYVTRLPHNDLGDAALNSLRKFGVDTSSIIRGGDRIGIYFLETGASQRSSKIIYDRKSSSIVDLHPGIVPWNEIFANAAIFHVTGITPALSAAAAETTLESVMAARKAGVTVTFDLNYRSTLWSAEQAGNVLAPILEHVDVLIANEEHVRLLFGIHPDDAGSLDEEEVVRSVSVQIRERFPSIKNVTMTYRQGSTATDNLFYAFAWDGTNVVRSRKYNIRIIDRVGGGDSFTAGFIYGLHSGKPLQESLEFAVGAACLKHTIPGDFNYCSTEEVEALIRGGGGGRVQR
jgi:2-dehydro-3-deoxygluconokinase